MFLCLFGFGINYSKSPLIGNIIVYKKYNFGYYFKYNTLIKYFIRSLILFFLKDGYLINITIPYKFYIYNFCNYISLSVFNTLSVNLLIRNRYSLIGLNTDIFGLFKVCSHIFPYYYYNFLVVGVGAVFRSVILRILILRYLGFIYVFNRSLIGIVRISYFTNLNYILFKFNNNNLIRRFFIYFFVPNYIIFNLYNYFIFYKFVIDIFDVSYNCLNFKFKVFYINGFNMLYLQAVEYFKIIF